MFTDCIETPLGTMRIVGDNDGVSKCDFEAAQPSKGEAPLCVREAKYQLQKYFKGELKEFTCKLNPKGTEFQMNVWNELLKIKWGETKTYLDIALKVGTRKHTRSVANAIGKNPIVIIIPCHRVIGSDGSLTGFSCGLDKKKYLLALETNK